MAVNTEPSLSTQEVIEARRVKSQVSLSVRVMAVLLRCCGMGASHRVEPYDRLLDFVELGVNIKGALRETDRSIELTSVRIV
jgi:hypothetical protein